MAYNAPMLMKVLFSPEELAVVEKAVEITNFPGGIAELVVATKRRLAAAEEVEEEQAGD